MTVIDDTPEDTPCKKKKKKKLWHIFQTIKCVLFMNILFILTKTLLSYFWFIKYCDY